MTSNDSQSLGDLDVHSHSLDASQEVDVSPEAADDIKASTNLPELIGEVNADLVSRALQQDSIMLNGPERDLLYERALDLERDGHVSAAIICLTACLRNMDPQVMFKNFASCLHKVRMQDI